jgi:YjjI family glycine radical enzyme
MTELRTRAREIVEDPALTYRQRMHYLAVLAEEALEYPALSEPCREALNKRIICDMHEGPAPHRPRYVLPDYAKALRQGSDHLELNPPATLDEALSFLLILYTQVPSITGYPVYLGDFDKLLAPFVDDVDDDTLHDTLRRFWISIDRVLPDAFVHTDLGPADTRVGRHVLALERELEQVVPNISLKVDPEITPDDYLRDAAATVFDVAQPHFVNHPMMVDDHGEDYAAVSCYNSLPIGGGSHTLVRMNLKDVVLTHQGDLDAFFATTLPHYAGLNAELIEARVRYLVEQAGFYDHHFLATEGLIDRDRFSAMFGVFGVAEAVDLLMDGQGRPGRYGHDEEANRLGHRITEAVAEVIAARPVPYCEGNGGLCFYHSQSGIDSDLDVTAGTRIPIGEEPDLYEHIAAVAPHHRLFNAGISDVFAFDDTVRGNPQAVVDVIRGAFEAGMRDFTFNLDSNDFIRITGYLVRKSDLARIDDGARHGSTFLGAGSMEAAPVTDRNPKRVMSVERRPRPAV